RTRSRGRSAAGSGLAGAVLLGAGLHGERLLGRGTVDVVAGDLSAGIGRDLLQTERRGVGETGALLVGDPAAQPVVHTGIEALDHVGAEQLGERVGAAGARTLLQPRW